MEIRFAANQTPCDFCGKDIADDMPVFDVGSFRVSINVLVPSMWNDDKTPKAYKSVTPCGTCAKRLVNESDSLSPASSLQRNAES